MLSDQDDPITTISFRLRLDQVEALRSIQRAIGILPSEQIRRAIDRSLAQYQDQIAPARKVGSTMQVVGAPFTRHNR
jgi:hypothetical protein